MGNCVSQRSMATQDASPPFEERLARFLAWVDGPAGIKRPAEIKIVQTEDTTRGLIGLLDLKGSATSDERNEEEERPSKRMVRTDTMCFGSRWSR